MTNGEKGLSNAWDIRGEGRGRDATRGKDWERKRKDRRQYSAYAEDLKGTGKGKARRGKRAQGRREEETREVERGKDERDIELIFILIERSPLVQRHLADKYLRLITLTDFTYSV